MDPVELLLNNLHVLVKRLDRVADTYLLKPFKITFPELMVLQVVTNRPAINQQEVARLCGLGKSSISQRVNTLVGKGLVERRVNPGNRQETNLVITALGAERLSKAMKELARHLEIAAPDIRITSANLGQMIQELSRQVGEYEVRLKTGGST